MYTTRYVAKIDYRQKPSSRSYVFYIYGYTKNKREKLIWSEKFHIYHDRKKVFVQFSYFLIYECKTFKFTRITTKSKTNSTRPEVYMPKLIDFRRNIWFTLGTCNKFFKKYIFPLIYYFWVKYGVMVSGNIILKRFFF